MLQAVTALALTRPVTAADVAAIRARFTRRAFRGQALKPTWSDEVEKKKTAKANKDVFEPEDFPNE